MKFISTNIADVLLLEPRVFRDERGFFLESFRETVFLERGLPYHFVQDNHSGSQQGVLRGLHYQIRRAQGKLVRVIRGEIFDVAVDLRKSSPTFGKWTGGFLSENNKHQFWIPVGFAHGYFVLSEWAEVLYKTTDYYAPNWERTLLWNDPEIGIEWPLFKGKTPILSEKDKEGKLLQYSECFE